MEDFIHNFPVNTDAKSIFDFARGLADDSEFRHQFAKNITSTEFLSALSKKLTTPAHDFVSKNDNSLFIALCLLTAELAKEPIVRPELEAFIPELVHQLSELSAVGNTGDAELLRQILRAIGNICYENDSARASFLANDGVAKLLDLLRKCSKEDKSCAALIIQTALGCLNNVLDSSEACQLAALGLHVMDILIDALMLTIRKSDRTEVFAIETFVLECFSCLTDHPAGLSAMEEDPTKFDDIATFLLRHMKDHPEVVMDILMKLQPRKAYNVNLVRAGAFETLMEWYNGDGCEDSDVVEMALNFLVELSADPACVAVLDAECDVSPVLEKISRWLDCTDQVQLSPTICAALLVGNLAIQPPIRERMFVATEGASPLASQILHSLSTTISHICQENEKFSCERRDPTDHAGNGVDADRTAKMTPAQPSISSLAQLQYALLSAVKNILVSEEHRRRLLLETPLLDTLAYEAESVDELDKGIISSETHLAPSVALQVCLPGIVKHLTILRMLAGTDKSLSLLIASHAVFLRTAVKWISISQCTQESLRFIVTTLKRSEFHSDVVTQLRREGLVGRLISLLEEGPIPSVMGALATLTVCLECRDLVSDLHSIGSSRLVGCVERCLKELDLPTTALIPAFHLVERLCGSDELRVDIQKSTAIREKFEDLIIRFPETKDKLNGLYAFLIGT